MEQFAHLAALTGTPREQAWLEERLETLSVKEGIVLAAALARKPPGSAGDAINHMLSLEGYNVCFPAENHKQLGEFYLRHEMPMPEDALPFVDVEKMGRRYEKQHPGRFVGRCYVAYPAYESLRYNEALPLRDTGWSVKAKLASPSVPEGVWLRLPDYACLNGNTPDEIALALDALQVRRLEDCTLLDARCILPEAGNLMEQYGSAVELAWDGNNLGYLLDEQGQGMPDWQGRFAAALEYEQCRTLAFALDIARNLHCYEWKPAGRLPEVASKHLRDSGVPNAVIHSGCINLEEYAAEILERGGYIMTADESGFVARNSREFVYEFSTPPSSGPSLAPMG